MYIVHQEEDDKTKEFKTVGGVINYVVPTLISCNDPSPESSRSPNNALLIIICMIELNEEES